MTSASLALVLRWSSLNCELSSFSEPITLLPYTTRQPKRQDVIKFSGDPRALYLEILKAAEGDVTCIYR